jgi:hypothetical protein
MKTYDINPQTLPTDLELVIGRTFEDDGKKKQFDELEKLFKLLIELGYQFNIIRELKIVKAIPFKRFTYQPKDAYAHLGHSTNSAKNKNDDLDTLKKLKLQAVEESNYELAASYRDQEKNLLSIDKDTPAENAAESAIAPQQLYGPKILKTHVTIEKSMIHIYLITRQDWFADKVHSLTVDRKRRRFAWLKLLIGNK